MKQIELNFINQICNDLEKLNGTNFEYLCKDILSLILNETVHHKGHNLYAKPVRSTGDFNTNDFQIIGQCGTEQNYFKNLDKPIKDIDSAVKNHKQCQIVYLFSNLRGSGGQLSDLNIEIQSKNYIQTVEVYDSERIAKEVIFKNIQKIHIIESLLRDNLPFSYELYRLLPQTNKIPDYASKKYSHREEEFEIIQKLEEKKFLQIYGISGIGKTETSKSIANNLFENYDTVIWVNCDEISNFEFSSVQIAKFNSKINLTTLIENNKIILILDNINDEINKIKNDFFRINENNSICLLTSLQKNLPDDFSYELLFMEKEAAIKILCYSDDPIDDNIRKIIDYIDGYPLLLNILYDAVHNDEYTWAQIYADIQTIANIEDPEKNKKIAVRIIEKYDPICGNELKCIALLKSRVISKNFLNFAIYQSGIISLTKRSIIKETEINHYTIHQFLLDSISIYYKKNIIEPSSINRILFDYLKQENEKKSAGYFDFIFTHQDFLDIKYNELEFSECLKKHILYAKVQARDIKKGNWYLDELKKYSIDLTKKIDALLEIEKIEIDLNNSKIKYKEDDYSKYEEICNDYIEYLENAITEASAEEIIIYLKHHLGKIYSRLKKYDEAISLFCEVIEKDNEADYSRLQIARIYTWYDIEDKNNQLNEILECMLNRKDNWERQSLSVLLSTYDLIADNKLAKYRKQYIDENITHFIEKLLYSLSFGFEQPFSLLAKLSYHLGYNKQEEFSEICENLPLPENIEENQDLKYSFATIQVAYYKLLKYSTDKNEEKMKKTLNIARAYFESIDLNDFQRGKYIDLLIESKQFTKAKDEIIKYSNKETDPFYFQKLCKIQRNLNDVENALISINSAIDLTERQEKYSKYISAFLNDKAETMYLKNKNEAIIILEDAILKGNNKKTISSWKCKLTNWRK